jgi:transcriptional regulator with XRE-family HTH domain
MRYELSKKEIGERIAKLRLIKSFSQEDLAKNIAISRPSLAQIELGNRSVSLSEMQRLSVVLGFSLDDFMTKDFLTNQSLKLPDETNEELIKERISVPTLNINKFKNVLLYI